MVLAIFYRVLHVLFPSSFTKLFSDMHCQYYYPHSINEETEALDKLIDLSLAK